MFGNFIIARKISFVNIKLLFFDIFFLFLEISSQIIPVFFIFRKPDLRKNLGSLISKAFTQKTINERIFTQYPVLTDRAAYTIINTGVTIWIRMFRN